LRRGARGVKGVRQAAGTSTRGLGPRSVRRRRGAASPARRRAARAPRRR
jgi:hypothetical protein